jgi:mono/diheme cytochrome c family protein
MLKRLSLPFLRFLKIEVALIGLVLVCVGFLSLGAARGGQQPKKPAKFKTTQTSRTATSTTTNGSEGEKRFQANCVRCHQAPEDLSVREVKAVIRHMRVKAMLSAEDEQLIVKYLAP